jgi:hypothetical protein
LGFKKKYIKGNQWKILMLFLIPIFQFIKPQSIFRMPKDMWLALRIRGESYRG